jgi:hypothetical protein
VESNRVLKDTHTNSPLNPVSPSPIPSPEPNSIEEAEERMAKKMLEEASLATGNLDVEDEFLDVIKNTKPGSKGVQSKSTSGSNMHHTESVFPSLN